MKAKPKVGDVLIARYPETRHTPSHTDYLTVHSVGRVYFSAAPLNEDDPVFLRMFLLETRVPKALCLNPPELFLDEQEMQTHDDHLALVQEMANTLPRRQEWSLLNLHQLLRIKEVLQTP